LGSFICRAATASMTKTTAIEIIEGDDAKLSQIERLASLKEKGHISAEEFQKKKKELL